MHKQMINNSTFEMEQHTIGKDVSDWVVSYNKKYTGKTSSSSL